jgi:hypothetical protein
MRQNLAAYLKKTILTAIIALAVALTLLLFGSLLIFLQARYENRSWIFIPGALYSGFFLCAILYLTRAVILPMRQFNKLLTSSRESRIIEYLVCDLVNDKMLFFGMAFDELLLKTADGARTVYAPSRFRKYIFESESRILFLKNDYVIDIGGPAHD